MAHVMELLGKTRVVVKDGEVVEVGEPQIDWCPLFAKIRGIEEVTKDAVRENMEFRIKDFGIFTDDRILEHEVFVGFGATEVMMSGLRRDLLDTTVTVCEGAGTVITNNPTLVQGMGARISGLVETEPIDGIINGITERGGVILNSSTAIIDPVAGVEKAVQLGYKRISVSAIDPATAKKLREVEAELDLDLTIIAAHTTGLSREDALELIEYVDIITSCASKTIRDVIKPLAQVGTAVPLFAITQKGKELLLERAKEVESPILINTMPLPVLPEHKQPRGMN
ncbi:methanogenesis marker 8 protein [Methanococcoides methylutens]|uniref:Putative methanogenesis marker protein 8 n=1 Tax=Methanococcoides methylutens MM1 TaxID=1434104 RepID=A0A0E3X0F9_METMT|nr:methanogenesis marker 8 protein [Methanococcoides methylutens]AKB85265.1 putative methanogenesis marker protein 8 [Methanococcoides methylutens MM1]